MRLPLRHPPPSGDAPLRTCRYLERLAQASIGLPLGPAATQLSSARSRGRHGSALQWHFGLQPHDGDTTLDWEDRIEIKLVSVWLRPGGTIGCDKLKVCDLNFDPWRKLSNVLWVFADRITRVIVGAMFWRLAGCYRERLQRSWQLDPHFDHPDLFVESRDWNGQTAPAYYLASRWFMEQGLLPQSPLGLFAFDRSWWQSARARHRRDPFIAIASDDSGQLACPRCCIEMRFDPSELAKAHCAPASHRISPVGHECLLAEHLVVDARWLAGGPLQSRQEFHRGVQGTLGRAEVWRLADRVVEPSDHEHPD